MSALHSPRDAEVREALRSIQDWDEAGIDACVRLLARDSLMADAVAALGRAGDKALSRLTHHLQDEACDFVVRRRIPRLLVDCKGGEANVALLASLSTTRFEVRYRAAVALTQRQRRGLFRVNQESEKGIWSAIDMELRRDRPVWELQRLLDAEELSENDLVNHRLGVRGELSLEHVFRLMGLVLEPEPVRAAFNGLLHKDENLKSFALEYLEQVLPPDVRRRLWYLVGDMSERERRRSERSLDHVVQDLMNSQATLFGGAADREALRRLIEGRNADEAD
jgi:hypothetical protein